MPLLEFTIKAGGAYLPLYHWQLLLWVVVAYIASLEYPPARRKKPNIIIYKQKVHHAVDLFYIKHVAICYTTDLTKSAASLSVMAECTFKPEPSIRALPSSALVP